MAGWNGSGVFQRLYSWVADAAAGIDISSTRTDADTNNITVNGFGNCLTRDGQGSATADLPMNGFRHTGVGNAVNPTDYVALEQLQPGGMLPGVQTLGAILGEMRQVALVEAQLATLAPGWHICAGGTRPRTDPLWVATGAVSGGNWVWGNGNGTTTYTLPDFRGRAMFGKDNMGGFAANRLTIAGSSVDGATLGAAGGDQALQTHNHGAVSTDSGHGHTAADAGHAHSATDSGHTHGIPLQTNGGGAANGTPTSIGGGAATDGVTRFGTASITVGVGNANITVATGTANVTTTIGNTGTGSSQNVPPAAVVNTIVFTGA